MKKSKTIFRLVLLMMLGLMAQASSTASYFSDVETSLANTLDAASLDMEFSTVSGDFSGGALTPGDSDIRDGSIDNTGELAFEYSQEYEFSSGDADLCAVLELEVEDAALSVVYSGLLSAFSYSPVGSLSSGGSDPYTYTVTLPASAALDGTLRNKTCNFNFLALANQEGEVYGDGYWDSERLGSSVASGVWAPPAPDLVSPADGTIAGIGSAWTASPIMDWGDVVWSEAVTYVYQASLGSATDPDGGLSVPIYTSGPLAVSEINIAGTLDGTYYWQARACDTTFGCGDWSSVWELTIDSTVQEASLGDVVINEVMWMGSTASTADEWIELFNTTPSPIVLKNWVIKNAGDAGTPDITLPAGLTLPANGYILVSNYSELDVSSTLAVTPDYVTTAIELDNTGEQLTLIDAMGNTIDQTPTAALGWDAGVNDNGTPLKQSMERNAIPGDGTTAANWHTCVDAGCNDLAYWDAENGDYGTPGALNLSSNDPTSPDWAPQIMPIIEEIMSSADSPDSPDTQEVSTPSGQIIEDGGGDVPLPPLEASTGGETESQIIDSVTSEIIP